MTDHEHLDASAMLALAEGERHRAGRQIEPNEAFLYTVWGVAWLVGPGLLYLARSRDLLSEAVAGAVFAALILGATVTTGVHIGLRVRGVRGVSSRVGAMYGWSWLAGFGGVFVIMTGLQEVGGLTGEALKLLWTALPCLVVGLLYMGAGALWQDRVQFVIGGWVVVVGSVGVLFGSPGNLAVMSLAGGGAFLLGGLLAWLRSR